MNPEHRFRITEALRTADEPLTRHEVQRRSGVWQSWLAVPILASLGSEGRVRSSVDGVSTVYEWVQA